MNELPRIGLLGIMQELYDDMIPGITEHQAQYAKRGRRAPRAASRRLPSRRPARNQADIEAITAELAAVRR